jgi:hypothetical protein
MAKQRSHADEGQEIDLTRRMKASSIRRTKTQLSSSENNQKRRQSQCNRLSETPHASAENSKAERRKEQHKCKIYRQQSGESEEGGGEGRGRTVLEGKGPLVSRHFIRPIAHIPSKDTEVLL